MSCQIKRNQEGRITDVTTPSGESSKLFRDIHGILFLADVDTSLRIFASAYSKPFEGGVEPALLFRRNGKVYSDLEELILAEPDGEIEVGLSTSPTKDNNFVLVASVDSSSENASQLASLVRQGYLSATRELDENGVTKFVGKGEFPTTRYFTASMSISELESSLGKGTYALSNDGTFTADLNTDYTTVRMNGADVIVHKSEVKELLKSGKLDNPVQAALEHIYEFDHPRALDKDKPVYQKAKVDSKGIQAGLLNFLKSVGFSATTLEEYRVRYNTKFGKDPDIRALADIANQVVAVDIANIEDLSEEVAHVAIEMYNDQASIAGVLASVHNTPEYAQFYDQYRAIYSPFYKGVELEDHVRKEVLGKILKKSIQERFSTAEKTEAQAYVTQRLAEIWATVMKFISSRLTPSHYQTLDILNNRIADSIFNTTSEDFETDISDNENFFYSLESTKEAKTIANELKVAKRIVEDLYRTALNESVPNPAALEHLAEVSGEYEMIGAINTIVGIAASQMNILKLNVEEAAKKGELVSMKDAARYQVSKENLIPVLNNLKVGMGKVEFTEKVSKKLLENIKKASDEVVVNLSSVEPLMNSDNDRLVNAMVDKVLDNAEITEAQKDEVREQVEGGIKDLNWAGKYFGLATHTKNMILQLMAKTVSAISTRVANQFNARLNGVVNEVAEKGWANYQKSIIKTGTHYFLSPINEAVYQKDLTAAQTAAISKLIDKTVEEVERLRNKVSDRDLLKTDEAFTQYKKLVKEWKEKDGIERRFTDKYYQDRDARFDKTGASEETRNYLSTKNASRFERLKQYQNPDGTIDASRQTLSEKVQDNAERKSHLAIKSPYDAVGQVKPGLRVVNAENLTEAERQALPFKIDETFKGGVVMVEEGVNLDDLTTESRLAFDLFNLDMLYREESVANTKTRKPLQQFSDKLQEIESTGQSSYEWALDNASISLTSDHYDNLGTPINFNTVAQSYVEGLDGEERLTKQALLDQLNELQQSRKAILKQNKYSNSAVETDVHHMTSLTRNRIIELDAEISDTRRALNIPMEVQEELPEMTGESDLNEDYRKMLAESNQSEYDFALSHMTSRNAVRVQDFAIQIDDIITGKRTRVKESYDEFINEMISAGRINESLSRQEAVEVLNAEFAKRHVASYFKRFQPAGYTTAIEKLKSGVVKVSDLVGNREEVLAQNPEFQFIEIIPDYSWSQDVTNEEYLNPNFKEGLSVRPKLSKYLDDEFFSRYGISKESYKALPKDDLSALTATKNVEEFEFLRTMVGINEETIGMLGNTGRTSKYQRPQISKGAFEKHVSVYKGLGKGAGANVKDFFKDFSTSQLDEKEYGDVVDGLEPSEIGVKVIPKYYQDQLTTPDIVTENTIEAVMVSYKAALRYKERVASERAIKALEHKISQQNFKNRGSIGSKTQILKKGSVSNYYQKAQEMADYHLYGIRQNRRLVTTVLGHEVDITQVLNRVTKYVSNVNLGFSPIVDLTSASTGFINNTLDRFGGEFYGHEAANKANSEIAKLIIPYVGESGKMNKSSDLNHLMEFFRVFESDDRLGNSAEGRLTRVLGRSRFAISKLANLPVTPRNMLAILYDFKFVEGRFISYRDFHTRMKAQDKKISSKGITALWKKNTDTLYSNLKIDAKKGVGMGDSFKAKFGESATQEFQDLQERLIDKITQINQSVDSIISEADSIAAKRDVLLSSMMLHRSWIVINLTRKFKGKHFNIATGNIEEGQYRSALNTAAKLFKSLGKKGAINEVWSGLEDYQMRNNKRTMAEVVAMGMLIALVRALLAADDDEDGFVEDLAQLIALRSLSETESSSWIGIPGTIFESYDDPLIQTRYLENVYKGFTKDPKYFLNNTFYKRYTQMSDLQKQVDSYQHFNGPTLVGIGASE